MKKAIIFILFFFHAVVSFPQAHFPVPKLTVGVNYNIELLGLAYFIGFEGVDIENKTVEINGKRIPKKDWHSYGFYIYEKYRGFAKSEHLKKSFTVADHLWLDYIIKLLVQTKPFPNAKLTADIGVQDFINFSIKKDTAEAKQNVTTFLDGLNHFYNEVNFNQYISETKLFYTSALAQVKQNLPDLDFVKAIESFYRKKFDKYSLVPSLTIPKGMGFGLKYSKHGNTTLFNVFGAFDFQSFQQPERLDLGFGNPLRFKELSIHEFGHSFVNPIVDKIPQEKVTKTDTLFQPIKEAMAKQGYNTWKVCLYEHFVRAGEVVIARLSGDKEGSERLRLEYIKNRSFVYLPIIIAELERYSKSKDNYYDAVIKAIDGLAKLK